MIEEWPSYRRAISLRTPSLRTPCRFGIEIETCISNHKKDKRVPFFAHVREPMVTCQQGQCSREFITCNDRELFIRPGSGIIYEISDGKEDDVTRAWYEACQQLAHIVMCSADSACSLHIHLSDACTHTSTEYKKLLLFHFLRIWQTQFDAMLNQRLVHGDAEYSTPLTIHPEVLQLKDVTHKIIAFDTMKRRWCRYQSVNIVGRRVYGAYYDSRTRKSTDSRFDLSRQPARVEIRSAPWIEDPMNMASQIHRCVRHFVGIFDKAREIALQECKVLDMDSLSQNTQLFRKHRALQNRSKKRFRSIDLERLASTEKSDMRRSTYERRARVQLAGLNISGAQIDRLILEAKSGASVSQFEIHEIHTPQLPPPQNITFDRIANPFIVKKQQK